MVENRFVQESVRCPGERNDEHLTLTDGVVRHRDHPLAQESAEWPAQRQREELVARSRAFLTQLDQLELGRLAVCALHAEDAVWIGGEAVSA
jgi:hypothetical protein